MDDLKNLISQVENNFKKRNVGLLKEKLNKEKQALVEVNDQLGAKEIWILETVLEAQEYFIESYKLLKKSEFYKGWCELEKVEIRIRSLSKHYNISLNEYKIDFIFDKVLKLQSLFPYKIFLSPEILVKSKKCSVCDKKISLRYPCGHKVGEIYDGEICFRKVEGVDFLGISLVENPVQKYSVAFPEGGDNHDYELVKFLIENLTAPFQDWDLKWEKRRVDHSKFVDLEKNDKCPCGSGDIYSVCCQKESGILIDWCVFQI